jgi:alkanesulfonate monooxygenase SsuD/methylene tetrahydromethanopterin reductase-like flavin-dependent oxidoreductase (luciferase family)
MITHFDSSFAGHIDMDNVGYAGTPVNDRRFSNEELAGVFGKADDIAKTLDRLGFETFWMAEHHFQHEGYECIPNLLLYAVHLTHITNKLKIGTGFNITPMWHPLRLAEDYAVADVLTGGRVVFGVGRGYHTREVEVFGSPLLDQAANRDLFEEQVDIIFKAFNNESFSHHGKNYTIPPENMPYRGYILDEITLVPRPVNLPVECWQPIQSASERGLDFMAKHGIRGVIGGGSADSGALPRVVHGYRDALARRGRETELGTDLAIGFHFYIAPTQEQGMKKAAGYFEENLKIFGPLRLVRSLTDQQIEDMGDPNKALYADLPRIEGAVKSGGFLCGTPESMIEQLKKIEEAYPGLDRVVASHPVGTPKSVILEQLQQFAEEVMPAFKGAKSPVSAD